MRSTIAWSTDTCRPTEPLDSPGLRHGALPCLAAPSIREGVMTDVKIRAAIDRHWAASAAGDQEAEHEIYQDTAIVEYPQSGERIRGRNNVQALRSHHPSKPSGFVVRRITGSGNLWVTEYIILL
jgi:hypothetical protein